MNANELMIGDWYFACNQHSTRDGKYTLEFYPKKLTIDDLIFAKENDWDELDWTEFTKPIQLTAEILEKNGFNIHETLGEWSPSINGFHFNNKWANELEIDVCGLDIEIKYVHKLQHALRLCGLNDLADDFKI